MMRAVDVILNEAFLGQERVSRSEIYRRAIAAEAPIDVINALDSLPEGEYSQDEVIEVLEGRIGPSSHAGAGVTAELSDDDVFRELQDLYRTRHDALRHGSNQALARHTERISELESEYLRRFPEREITPERLRAGARAR